MLSDDDKVVAAKVLALLLEPSKAVIDCGETVLEDHEDSDWDSGPNGESHNSYTFVRSGAAKAISEAMIVAFAVEQGIALPDPDEIV